MSVGTEQDIDLNKVSNYGYLTHPTPKTDTNGQAGGPNTAKIETLNTNPKFKG